AFAEALERLVEMFQQFDRLSRFRLAASDMQLVTHAAKALIDARENDGPARLYERIIETGMVVTYARPFLKSNEAGAGAERRRSRAYSLSIARRNRERGSFRCGVCSAAGASCCRAVPSGSSTATGSVPLTFGHACSPPYARRGWRGSSR